MSDYTQIEDFSAKDALASGDPEKIIAGADIDAELAAISTAIATKANSASPTLTGTITINGATVAGDATFSGAITHSGATTFSGAVTATGTHTLQSTDAGASAGPTSILDRNSASPAASDVLGAVAFKGRDSGGGTDTYAQVQAEIVDPTATSEDGELALLTAVAGALAKRGYVRNGMVMGSATGGDQGAGTINAAGVYDDGVLLGAAASGSSKVLLASATASGSAAIEFTSGISSTYDEYEIVVVNAIPASNNIGLLVQMSNDGGSSYVSGAGDYQVRVNAVGTNGTDYSANSTGTIGIGFAGSGNGISNATTGGGMNLRIHLFKPSSTTANKHLIWEGSYAGAAAGIFTTTNGVGVGVAPSLTNSAVNALKFAMTVGNIASGDFYLYGVKKS